MSEDGTNVGEYKYFVTYTACSAGRTGVYRCEVTQTHEVQCMSDIEDVEQTINAQYFKGRADNVIVTGIQRFPI